MALDGRRAAGKTALANGLARRFNARVVGADDFFLPAAKRVPERLSRPGGVLDYERFIERVVCGIKSGKDFKYDVFSCKTNGFTGVKNLARGKPIIIEGAYSTCPSMPNVRDLDVFPDVDDETQPRRIIKRNGEREAEAFVKKWIPLENEYFKAFDIKKNCDFVLTLK